MMSVTKIPRQNTCPSQNFKDTNICRHKISRTKVFAVTKILRHFFLHTYESPERHKIYDFRHKNSVTNISSGHKNAVTKIYAVTKFQGQKFLRSRNSGSKFKMNCREGLTFFLGLLLPVLFCQSVEYFSASKLIFYEF